MKLAFSPTRAILPLLIILLCSGHMLAEWPQPPVRTGLLYISGYGSNNVGEYLPDGTLLRVFTDPNMLQPRGVAVDADGNLVVVCQGSARILRLDLDGNVIQTVTHADLTSGTGISQAPNGNWYVGNFSPGRVVVFDSSWNYVSTITETGMNGVNCIAFDGSGAYAVTSATSGQVFRFDAAGVLLGTTTHGSMLSPMSIALDSSGNHYVSNGSSGVVIKFDAAWNAPMTFGLGTLASPQGIAVDEHDVLTITNFSSSTVHRYDTLGQILGSFPLTGVTTGRNIAWQTSPKVLARQGSVAAGISFPAVVLSVPGETPDALGRLSLPSSQPFQMHLAASPAGPGSAPFVLYLFPGEPGLSDVETLPLGIGLFSFPTPLSGAPALALMNSLGLETVLGHSLLPPSPAPTTVLAFPVGAGITGTWTFQALMLDLGAPAAPALPISPSNAIVLTLY